jgi:hypothetical protein
MRDRWTELVSPVFCDRDVLRRWTAAAENHGALYGGLSSEGPLLYALIDGEDRAVALAGQLERVFSTICREFRVARVGNRLVTKPG